jgi:tRNA dimethylallyltransferase
MQKQAIILAGPTAAGKTDLAIQLAQRLGGIDPLTGLCTPLPILSADSRQCFRELDIGVAKPTVEQRSLVPHYFVDTHSIQDDVNAAVFERYALDTLHELFKTVDRVVVVGGTGLYLKALIQGLDDMPVIPGNIRREIEILYREKGLESLQDAIRREDPLFAQDADLQNPQRLIRALEVVRATGHSIRHFQQSRQVERDFTMIRIALDFPREELYQRINRRVDLMMERGLLEEVRSLLPYRHLNALQTVGYRELFEYLDGKATLEDAVNKIKQHTRNYAKRQLTWFRADPAWQWIPAGGNLASMLDRIEQIMEGVTPDRET